MGQKLAAKYMTHELTLSLGYVRTPGGFRHRSFVHQLGAGRAVSKQMGRSSILDLVSGMRSEVPAPEVPNARPCGNGWRLARMDDVDQRDRNSDHFVRDQMNRAEARYGNYPPRPPPATPSPAYAAFVNAAI